MLLGITDYLDLATPGLKIICDGNSITAGQSHATELAFREPFLTNSTVIHNFGVGGQTTEQMLADMNTEVIPLITFDPPTIVIVLEFGNSITGGATPQRAFELFSEYCTRCRSAGAYVVACTAHPRNKQGSGVVQFSDDIKTANQLLRDRWRGIADAIFDVRTIPQLANVTRQYFPDDVHPNREADILFTDGLMPVLRRIPVRG
jgi:lysophospholipase L1-like esterase